jgi:hypothetical protein
VKRRAFQVRWRKSCRTDKRVERETAFREQFSDLGEDHAQTIVWTAQGRTAPGRPTALASIARKQWVKPYAGNFVRFSTIPEGPFGILGHFEYEKNGVVFLTPLWIWFERRRPSNDE